MLEGFEYGIIIGIVAVVIVILIIIEVKLNKFFPKNKFSKFLEKISDWIFDNFRA